MKIDGIDKKIRPFVLANFKIKSKFPQIKFNMSNIENFYSIINKHKIQSVLIEGGIKTFKNFLINGAFNEVVMCQSSKMINKSKKRYKLDKKLIKNRIKKIDSQEYFRDKIEIYKNV